MLQAWPFDAVVISDCGQQCALQPMGREWFYLILMCKGVQWACMYFYDK